MLLVEFFFFYCIVWNKAKEAKSVLTDVQQAQTKSHIFR